MFSVITYNTKILHFLDNKGNRDNFMIILTYFSIKKYVVTPNVISQHML